MDLHEAPALTAIAAAVYRQTAPRRSPADLAVGWAPNSDIRRG